MARLVLLGDDERIVELQPGSNALGREPGNAILVDSPGVSRHHATIRWEAPYCRVIDHESTNGTFINGERIEVKGVKTGDILRTGPLEWRIELEDPAPAIIETTKRVQEHVDATVLEVLAPNEITDLRQDLAKRGRPLRSDRDLATLYRTVDTLVKSNYPRSLLKEISDVLVEAFSASGVAAFLYDTQTGDFEMAAGATIPPGKALPVSRTIVQRAIREQETLLVRNAAAEGLSAESGSVTSLRIQSALAAPLHSQSTPLGALQLSRGPDQRPFNEKDLRLFSVIAELVALALVNCRRREELESENIALGEIVKGRFQMLGNSAPIRKVFDTIEQAAKSTLTILVQGASGTGKELVARAIHSRSARRAGPFVAMNCAAVPESLAESELFGHEKGSFTGASERRQGCFERASKGTLFLDEIGDLPLAMQAKLLRVLEQGELTRVGGSGTVKVDVRLVAATNRDLENQVRAGTFRQDLFYRLQVVVMQLPSLADRREDIPLLAEHFLAEYRETSRGIPHRLSPEAIEKLVAYPWPGNVRELRNAIVRAAALSQNEELTTKDFGFLSSPMAALDPTQPLPMEEVEKRHIREVLEYCDWKREQAAEILGIDRKTLFNKIHRYNIVKTIGDD
jgi:transcriptional regulator with GAF, ATPase, and Fis domain